MVQKKRVVVVGNGMVGHRFIERMIDGGHCERWQVETFCEEPRLAYDRSNLSRGFSGASAAELALVRRGQYSQAGITVHLADKAVGFDRDANTVTSERGHTIEYDKLVLATGSSPFVPPVAGWRAPGCFVYRTLGDLEAIRSHASAVHIGVVIGGGLLGLEAAYALERLGLRVHVVEVAPRLLHRQLDETGGALVRARVQALGITVHTGATTTAILTDDDDCTAAVRFADGNELPTDLVLFCAGVRPRDELARAAGLNMGKRGGVVIDERCRTSDPDIYAIGDCTLYCGSNYGLTAPGYEMAEVAVEDITGSGARRYRGGDPSSRLALAGVEAASFGDAFGVTEGARVISFFDGAAGIYKKLVVSGDGKSLLGGMLVGDASAYDRLHQLVRSRAVLPPHPEELVLPERSDDASGLALPTLRDAASAC